MEQTNLAIGKVKAVAQRDKNYSLNIDDVWYSAFGKSPVQKGDNIKFEWKQKGDFKNIDKILNMVDNSQQSGTTSAGNPSLRDKLIIRQSCLKSAVEISKEADKVLEIASVFESWVLRE